MINILPKNFLEFVAAVVLAVGVICALLSFVPCIRSHATKVFAIGLVTSLSLFADHWAVYFAGVFIVATAVTELEFLQNLAAIIRKDEHYFNYRKEMLTQDEALRRKSEEVLNDDAVNELEDPNAPVQPPHKRVKIRELRPEELSHRQRMSLAFTIEDKTLDYLCNEIKKPIERNVRFRKDSRSVEFDGFVEATRKDEPDILIEIKSTIGQKLPGAITMQAVKRFRDQINTYNSITDRKGVGRFYIVFDETRGLSEERLARLRQSVSDIGVDLGYLTFENIGLHEFHLDDVMLRPRLES